MWRLNLGKSSQTCVQCQDEEKRRVDKMNALGKLGEKGERTMETAVEGKGEVKTESREGIVAC